MERYDSYKDSGVEWIGEIPAHWVTRRMKSLASAANGLTYSPDDIVDPNQGTLVLRSSNIKSGKLDFDDAVYVNCEIPETKKVQKNTVLICSRNGSRELIGKNALIPEGLDCTFGAFMMLARPKCHSKYFYYVLNSELFSYYLGTYLTSTVNQLTVTNFNSMVIPYTNDINEQVEIAAFLDKKTSQIDSLIEKSEKSIELLEEYRKSVISEAVTKGLDPNAPMKQTKSTWLKEIPGQWSLVPLKYLSLLITDGTHVTPKYVDEGVPFISIKDISSGVIDFSDCRYITESQHLELSKSTSVEDGDVLFTRIGTLGKALVVRNCPTFDIFVSVGLVKPNQRLISPEYLAFCMQSDYYCSYIQAVKAGGGTAAAKYNLGDVNNSPIALPLIGEQVEIINYLNKKTAEIDSLISKKKQLIEKLQEYRKSLISDCVTGKIKVPGVE